MKYLDSVELLKERKRYVKAGVNVGDFGAVMSENAIDGKWQMMFSEFYTGRLAIMKFLDTVQVVKDRDEYKKEEVYSGMIGTIMDAEIRDNYFHVIFVDPKTKEKGFEFTDEIIKTIKEDILCPIRIVDLKLIKDNHCSDDMILDAIPKHNPDWWCKVEEGFILNLKGEKKNKIAYAYNS